MSVPPAVVVATMRIDGVQCSPSLTEAGLRAILQEAIANVARVPRSTVTVNITSGCNTSADAKHFSRERRLAQPIRRLQSGSGITAVVELVSADGVVAAGKIATALTSAAQDGSLVQQMQAVAPACAVAALQSASVAATVVVEQRPAPGSDESGGDERDEYMGPDGSSSTNLLAVVLGSIGIVLLLLLAGCTVATLSERLRWCRGKRVYAVQ